MNKKYTEEALHEWFRRYRKDWASIYFNSNDAENGIKFYNDKVIKDLDISKFLIIASGRVGHDTYFATIESINGSVSIAYSHGNDLVGKALAFAAFLALDDVFFENLGWLGVDKPHVDKSDVVATIKSVHKRSNVGKLVFFKKNQQLCFELFFFRDGEFINAETLGGSLRSQERESLMSVIHFGKKYSFERHFYTFHSDDISCFNDIISSKIRELEDFFTIEISDEVKLLARDASAASLSIDFSGGGIRNNVIVDGHLIDNDEFCELQKARRLYWSKKHGLVKIDNGDLGWLNRISKIESELNANPPLYLALSLFRPEKILLSDWMRNWIKNLGDLNSEIDLPDFLYNYQKVGVLWLYKLIKSGCNPLLADEMGLGKTLQVLSLLSVIDDSTDSIDIIVCPATVVSVWHSEIARFFPGFFVICDKKINALSDINVSGRCILIVSYSQLIGLNTESAKIRTVVLDEAQYIKNPKSKTARTCFSIKSKYKIAITGTPIENKYDDIWSIFNFLMPFLLGKYKEFKKIMAEEFFKDKLSIQLAPFVLRRTKESVLTDLPNKNESIVLCKMTDVQEEKYKEWLSSKNDIKAGEWSHLFALILRLRQICCDVGMLPNNSEADIAMSAKIRWLIPKISECKKNNDKIVIFSQFKKFLDRLMPIVQSIYDETYMLNGTIPQIKRNNIIKNFQSSSVAALLLTTKTGGTGITLNSANIVFMLDPWWNPAAEAQAVDRLHRIGQKNNVFIYKLITPNSIEEKVQQSKLVKMNYLAGVFSKVSEENRESQWSELLQLL